MEQKFTFTITLPEAQIIVAGLKKLPMENVENLVKSLDAQFVTQIEALRAKAKEDVAKPITENSNSSGDGSGAEVYI